MSEAPIYVTRPALAPLNEVMPYLEEIWTSGVMTHNGPLVQQLEERLADYLGVRNLLCVSSASCALQLAIHALDLTGEIITSPFTYIATANIIDWERCCPVFAEIDPGTWNLDPARIEEAITERTTAIMPVHVFSAPCDIEAIDQIAKRHGLKVIYDAAHAMAVSYRGQSVLRYGDVSCVSFHATKLYNATEGGACVTDDDALAARIRRMRAYGFNTQKEIADAGMNAKMTEVHAAIGLANFGTIDAVLANRRRKWTIYKERLKHVDFLTFQQHSADEYNYTYFPVLFDSEARLLSVFERLEADNVFPRRYFYPALHTVSLFAPQRPLPIAEDVSPRAACLPLFDTLPDEDIERICGHVEKG